MHTSFIHKPSLKPWREWQMPSTFILLYNIFLILPLQNPIYFIPEEISWASPGFTVLWSFWQDRPWFWWWWWGGLGPIILDLINQNPQPFANGFTSTLAYKQQTTQIPHWLNLEWGSTGWARPAPSQSNFGDPWSHGQLRKRFIHPNPPQTPFASDLRTIGSLQFEIMAPAPTKEGSQFWAIQRATNRAPLFLLNGLGVTVVSVGNDVPSKVETLKVCRCKPVHPTFDISDD